MDNVSVLPIDLQMELTMAIKDTSMAQRKDCYVVL
jgi:hypothetical protein